MTLHAGGRGLGRMTRQGTSSPVACLPGQRTGKSTSSAPEQARGRRPTVPLMLGEVALVCSLMVAYSAARLLGGGDVATAFRHAGELLRVEQWLSLPREQGLQDLLLRSTTLPQLANLYYKYAHLTVATLALLWLFWTHPVHYLWARRALLAATFTGLAVYLLVPVAPPRMLGSMGFVDVAHQFGQSVYGSPTGGGLTNQYAAMPSLHVGWSLLIATVCIAAGSRRRRWLWLLHPAITVMVVVSTGNHYWLDAAVGAVLVGLALAVTGCAAHADLHEPAVAQVGPAAAHV